MDQHNGKSGTFIVKDGKREPVSPDSDGNVTIGDKVLHRPATAPHKDGDAPRDAGGKRTDRGGPQELQAKPQPALPEPAKRAPWQEESKEATADAGAAKSEEPGARPRR